jgi:hypothetical protein
VSTTAEPVDSRKHLITLQFRYRPGIAGEVTVYELSPPFAELWRELTECHRRRHENEDVQPPYSSLVTALRAISGTCVQLWLPTRKCPGTPKLVSRRPLNADDRHDSFDFWVQAFDGPGSRWRALGELAAQAKPDHRPITDFIRREPARHQPTAPNWVFDLAEWDLLACLAHRPFQIGEQQYRFRQTTDGSLVCWDTPWASTPNPKQNNQVRYAMARLEGRLQTSPYVHDPIIVLDAYVSRLADRWTRVATAYLAPPDDTKPIVVAHLDQKRVNPRLNTYTVQVARRLHAQAPIHKQASLPTFPTELGGIRLDGKPGDIRALVPKSIESPHGFGMGMQFFRLFNEHIVQAVPELAEDRVRYTDTGLRFSARKLPKHLDTGVRKELAKRFREAILPIDIPAAVHASGVQQLRIVCLYSTPETRTRMVAVLYKRLDLGRAFSPRDDHETLACGGTVSIVFHQARDLLARGNGIDRVELLKDLPGLNRGDGMRVVTWCETDYDPDAWFPTVEERRAHEDGDAKFPVRQLLAARGTVSQFLRFQEAVDPSRIRRRARSQAQREQQARKAALPEDHPAERALSDLLRSAGLLDARMGHALGKKDCQQIWHVGLHIRRQSPPRSAPGRRKAKARLTITLVAIRPIGGVDEPWEVLAYEPRRQQSSPTIAAGPGWHSYADATAAFHAAPLAEGGLTEDDRALIAEYVHNALAHLRLPYIVYLSAMPGRRVWRGLQNEQLDVEPPPDERAMWLPGLDLPASQRPLAVVRINHDREEIGKPVGVRKGGTWIATTKSLFRKDSDGPHTSWLLSTIPRGYAESLHGRPGEDATRWDVEPRQRRNVMYSHTATEIFPIGIADQDRERYGRFAAELIEQAPSHDYRVDHPAPLHLARKMDEDHPQYRRTMGSGDSATKLPQ